MPEEIEDTLAEQQAAMTALAIAEDARDAAADELNAAQDKMQAAEDALEAARDADRKAHHSHVAALRRHGYVQTASGPAPRRPQFGDYLYTITCCGMDLDIKAGHVTGCTGCGTTFSAPLSLEAPAPLTQHDPAGCGCGAHQGGPGYQQPNAQVQQC